MKKTVNKLKNIKIPMTAIGVIAAVVVGAGGFFSYQYTTVKNWSNLIYPGVKIGNESLSGKTKEEAKKIIQTKYGDEIAKKKIKVSVDDKTYALDYSKLNLTYNLDDTVNEAYSYGKNGNLFKKYSLIKSQASKVFKMKFSYNSKPVEELINNIEKETNKEPVDASLKGYGGNFTVNPEVSGKKLKTDKVKKEIASKLNGGINGDVNVKAQVEIMPAKITADKISSINTKIASYSTDYGSISSAERANNIVLATTSINGKIVMPGDTFSFNDIVGERTSDKGYMGAPVIIGNQVESGLGGGICQVSTTLYNAVLRANIKATERAPHTLPAHYVPLGQDATVDFENIDYEFKNTLSYPIYVEGDASGGVVAFNIYSNSSLANTAVEINSEVYQTIQPGVRYEDDASMADGTTETIQNASTGYKVKVTKIVNQDGKTSTDLISDDFYKPVDQVIKRGTKK